MYNYYLVIGEGALRDGPEGDSFRIFTTEKEAVKSTDCTDFTVFKLTPVAEYEESDTPRLVRRQYVKTVD